MSIDDRIAPPVIPLRSAPPAAPDGPSSPRGHLLAAAPALLEELRALPERSGLFGCLGDALFACALGRLDSRFDGDPWLARAWRILDRQRPGVGLHRGLAGLGFVLALYRDAEPLLAEIDATLLRAHDALPPASLQSGLAGLALYASVRSHSPSGRALQRALIDALAAAAVRQGEGLVWCTPADYARSRRVNVLAEPIVELGIVHGLAGTLVGLAALASEGHFAAATLARAGLAALWDLERPGHNRFGRVLFGPGGTAGTLELDGRWCVGDVGVLRAAWLAGPIVGDRDSAVRALAHLRELAHEHAASGVAGDATRLDLCCGSSVVAQVHLLMYGDTGEPIFRAAHERLAATCTARFDAILPPNFAYGRAGVLLALLADEGTAPGWDAMLGLRLPVPYADRPRFTLDPAAAPPPATTRAAGEVRP